jgi:hypothetical protein
MDTANIPTTARMMKSQMKTMLITFFDSKGTIHFEFIPYGQSTKLILCGNTEVIMWSCA